MAKFYYKASTKAGEIKEGEIDAFSMEEARKKIASNGLIPISISDSDAISSESIRNLDLSSFFKRKKKVKSSDILLFTEKLAVLLRSGLPIDRSLSLMVELSETETMRDIASSLLKDVNAGKSLADAMTKFPDFFSKLYVNMIKAGESAGVVDVVMEQLLDYLRQKEELKSYVISSLIYPALLLFVGILTVGILVGYVLPKFQEIFKSMGQELPVPTQIMMNISDFFMTYKWLILLFIFLLWFGYKKWVSTEKGRRKRDEILLKFPVIKRLVIESETARLASTAGILVTSAVPLISALNIVREIISNSLIREAFDPVIKGAKKGEGIARPLRDAGIFPPLAVHLIQVGEESGTLGKMLLKVGEIFQENIKKSIKAFVSLFEPVLILVMGIIVGLIVGSMLMAIFSINEAPF